MIRATMAGNLPTMDHHCANQKIVHCVKNDIDPARSLWAGEFLVWYQK